MKILKKASTTVLTAIVLFSTIIFILFALQLENDVFYISTIKKAAEYYLACLAEASFFGFMFELFSGNDRY